MPGRSGPPPKPTALRLLHGDRTSRINTSEPIPRDIRPVLPKDIAQDVREIWDYTLGELDAMKIASAADRDSLICYCEAVVAHRKASAVIAKSSILIKGAYGGLVRNPALQIQRDAATTIRNFAQEFGLTPSGRSRITAERRTGAEHPSNPFAATG